MSWNHYLKSARAFAVIGITVAGLLVLPPALAQQPAQRDDKTLDQAARQEVAAQVLREEVRNALAEAERLASSDPRKAVESLKKILAQLEDESVLPEDRRQALKRMIEDRIRIAQSGAAGTEAEIPEQAQKQSRVLIRRAEEDRLTEQDKIRRLMDGIKKLQGEGKGEEAGRQASDLAGRYHNSAAQAASRTTTTNNQIASNRQLQDERERRLAGSLREVDRTALPPRGDMEFPKNWQSKSTRRQSDAIPLTDKEKAILRALDSTISVRFKDSRFEDVVEYLQTKNGQPLILDKTALDQATVTYDTPITLNMKGVTVRTVLRKLLHDLGLAYIVKEETIQVVTAQQAKEEMVVRTYYIGDLALARFQVAHLIDLIQSTIEPQSWRANGGEGTIFYEPITRCLVIKQSSELHPVLSSGLR